MLRLSRWKVILVLAATVLAILFAMPNALSDQQLKQLPGWLPHQRLNLGLDLQGGSYLLYEVDVPALRKEKMTNLTEDVRTSLSQAKIAATSPVVTGGDTVDVRITDPTQVQAAYTELQNLAAPLPSGVHPIRIQTTADQHVRLTLSEQGLDQEARSAVDQSMKIVRRRVDAMGTKEVSIVRQGATRIVIEAPGESDPEKLKHVIGQTAKLTFQMVDDTITAQEAATGRTPPGSVLLPSTEPYDPDGVVVKRRALVTGEMLSDARFANDPQTARPVVTFRFNGMGARKFGEATLQGVGKRFAIVLDNKVISAPNINEPITGGSGQISGNFTEESASELALLLRSGALPAPLKVMEQRTVGAELGKDAIDRGMISIAIGGVAILIFIILAYGLFGVFSAIALFINGCMLIAALSVAQATLTLPGIAGMILTLAVAVDANVLIFERARDEARAGRSALAAMDHGYSLAMPSIFDANLTTMISAIIMFWLGAGPVRGFAWTLMTGVMTSVFTAILVTQVLIGWWFRVARPKQLPI
jgi:preprotein translocase subunit SecD